ncbi:MAG: S53 family peptidase, partial [Candidatus Acidiferrales bacterium]
LRLRGEHPSLAAPPQRIHGYIGSGRVYRLPGNIHRIPASARDMGPADSSLFLPRVTIHLEMTSSQQAELKALLAAQQTRGNRQYHKWLTPEQFAARFGANESDIQRIGDWLQDQGFSDVQVARGRNAISFSGTVEQVENTFGTTLHRVVVNGTPHYANWAAPVLPAALKGIVEGIRGLNNFRPNPHLTRRRSVLRPQFTGGIANATYLTPADFATIYDVNPVYNSGIDGTGITIVVVGQSDIQLSDVQAFRKAAGLPVNDPKIILTGADPGNDSDNQTEADLDLEWTGGIAKNASVVYVNSTNAFTSADYAIQNDVGDVLLFSYGLCESDLGSADANSINSEFEQATAQGMTVVASSGDTGPAGCDQDETNPPHVASHGLAVLFPASSPYVTSVGGTEFSEASGTYWQRFSTPSVTDITSSALSYIPETAWNDTGSGGFLSASGGGASALFSKPAWQVGRGVPADAARDVPDVAFSASPVHDAYLYCSAIDDNAGAGSNGICTDGFRDGYLFVQPTGGTSAADTPFAGIVALLDQKLGGRQGNINAKLYALSSISTDAFHDITQSNNIVPCQQNSPDCPATEPFQFGYSAGPGYDQATGLGSIDAYNLLREWDRDFSVAVDPSTLALTAGVASSATVTVTPFDGFDTAVAFTCTVGAELANTTCSIPGTVPGAGTATLTISTGSAAAGSWNPTWLGGAGFCGIILALLWPRRHTRLAAATLAFAALAAVSCGGGQSPTASMSVQSAPAPQTGTVTVTATAGALSHTASLSVTVE